MRTTCTILLAVLVGSAATVARPAGKLESAGGKTIPRTARAASFTVW